MLVRTLLIDNRVSNINPPVETAPLRLQNKKPSPGQVRTRVGWVGSDVGGLLKRLVRARSESALRITNFLHPCSRNANPHYRLNVGLQTACNPTYLAEKT